MLEELLRLFSFKFKFKEEWKLISNKKDAAKIPDKVDTKKINK